MFKPSRVEPIIVVQDQKQLDDKPRLTLYESAIVAIAEANGFKRSGHGWPAYDTCDASAFLEMREKIWLYPDSNYLTWTVKFRTIEQLRLFEIKYSEYL